MNFLKHTQYSWLLMLKTTVILALVAFLVGCPMHSSKPTRVYSEVKGSSYYLAKAESSSGSKKVDWQLLAIQSLIDENKITVASSLLRQLPANLTPVQQQDKLLSQGEISIQTKQAFNLSLLNSAQLSDAQKVRYYRIKIAMDGQSKNINAQIASYIELQKYGTKEQRQQTINDTWNFLSLLPEGDTKNIIVYANDPVLQGWIDLLYTSRNNTGIYQVEEGDDESVIAEKEAAQLGQLKQAINDWQTRYPAHPAALYLPRNIYGDKYQLPSDSNQKSVALFLPLSGSSKAFGDALRQGYTDAARFYMQETPQKINVFDTAANSLEILIQQAKQQGAELIVGPLLKEEVLVIEKLAPSIPVLALNRTADNQQVVKLNNKMCFFSLSPEDEAIDAAQHIYHLQKTKPLLLVPQNELGRRIAQSFAQQWQRQSGSESAYVQYFTDAKALRATMNKGKGIEVKGDLIDMNNSYQSNSLNNILDSIVSNAPSNERFDAIYVYASYDELTLIKSMLDMQPAEPKNKGANVPVALPVPAIFASSRSNIASATSDFRFDMDGVQFSEIPFIVKQNNAISELPNYIQNDYSLVRLYAMGIDAWRLANRFNQLKTHQANILTGMTGNLSITGQCEITRTLTWQQYSKGGTILVP